MLETKQYEGLRTALHDAKGILPIVLTWHGSFDIILRKASSCLSWKFGYPLPKMFTVADINDLKRPVCSIVINLQANRARKVLSWVLMILSC